MIYGVGVDVVRVSRFRRWLDSPSLLERHFTSVERQTLESRGAGAVESLAARFAAKEALAKSLGLGLGRVRLHEIEVVNRPDGAPFLRVFGKTAETIDEMGNFRFHVSLSHDRTVAVAVVVAEVVHGG